MLKKISSVCLILLLLFNFNFEVSAATNSLSVPIRRQYNNYWCWAACGVSTVDYKKLTSITQEEFYHAARGETSYQDIPESPNTIQNGLRYYNLQSSLITYESVPNYHLLSLNSIMNQIDSNKPIIGLTYPQLSDAGHYRVIRGYSTGASDLSNIILLMDPASGSYTSVLYNDYCSSPSSIWTAAIYNIG